MKKRYIIFAIYLVLMGLICLTTGVLAKYIISKDSEFEFVVGNSLYFNYERSELYRNDQVVSPIPSVYEEDGVQYKVLDIMDVIPEDTITYYFYVSNFNELTGQNNLIDGVLFPNANATLSLPIKGEIYNVGCTILYRQVPYGPEDSTPDNNVWKNLVDGQYIDLPNALDQKIKYEFKVTIVVNEQTTDTTHEDYFNALLSIKLFINAASE